jgi:Dockerin type I domain
LRKYLAAAVAAVTIPSLAVHKLHASVPVEQIEAFEVDSGDNPNDPTRYAPIDFGGQSQVTVLPGQDGGGWPNITFHAVSGAGTTNTYSGHAGYVGGIFYANTNVAFPFVTDVYCDNYENFLDNTVDTQDNVSNNGPAPGHFAGGAKVINTSFIVTYGVAATDLDALRRLDFMINRDDVVMVASAATQEPSDPNNYTLNWSAYDTLAVTADDTFTPTNSPGKTHGDITAGYGHVSFVTAIVSADCTALWGTAQTAGQIDAQHGITVRSLMMAGTDKNTGFYTPTTVNHLDAKFGAGNADYNKSLSILQGGEKSLLAVAGNNSITGTPATNQQGWGYGTIAVNGRSAVLFQTANALTGLTASLNWNVNQNQPQPNEIDTTDAGTLFPHLYLELWPVTGSNGNYTLGTEYSDSNLLSQAPNDNVQYLYYQPATPLPAGTYALVITGDSSLSSPAALSYLLNGSFASQWGLSGGASWNTPGDWSNGIPNGQGAQANFLTSPTGLNTSAIITLDGSRTVGQMTFNNSHSYTINAGTGGSLTIDDTGDSTAVNPLITVVSGSHTINVPMSLVNGVTITTASSTGLTLGGAVTGGGNLTVGGAGTVSISSTGSIGVPAVVNGKLTFALQASGGIFAQTTSTLTINNGGLLTVADPGVGNHANRTVLIAGGLNFAGSSNAWHGQLDLAGNDMIVHGGTLSTIFNQLHTGFANGAWNGQGIISSTAASTPLTALGILQPSATMTFDNQPVSTTDVLIKYTYYGDANLDGHVDGTDYSLIDTGYGSAGTKTGWQNGDFNYDGKIDGSDYSLIDNTFNQQSAAGYAASIDFTATQTAEVAAPGAGVVPEPGCVGLVGFIGLLMVRRRSKPSHDA